MQVNSTVKKTYTSVMEGKFARKVTAIEHYEKFLDLWKDTDWDSCLDGNGIGKD
jgi:hypothetical protein